MSNKIHMLIADDDESVLLTLSKIISNNFSEIEVHTEDNGADAWKYIKNHHPSIVISDIMMPGLNGFELTQEIRNEPAYNDMIIILLTAHSDNKQIQKGLSLGADEFISKPLVVDLFTARIKSALRILKLQLELREENSLLIDLADELEQDIQDMTMLALKFMQARIPNSFDTQKRVAEAAIWIAKQYGGFSKEELRYLEIAAYLSQSGRIFLPDSLLNKPVMSNGRPTGELMYQVPISGKNIVSSVTRFKDVGNIIYHIYENLDGSGIPDKLKSWQIPFESRIIRAALDYEEQKNLYDKKPEAIINMMLDESKRIYDHRVIVLLDHFIKSENRELYDPNEKPVKLSDLKTGMIIARDIITDKGLKIVPKGFILKENTINFIISHNTNDPILGDIYINK
jgi:putative two-component system response regulator